MMHNAIIQAEVLMGIFPLLSFILDFFKLLGFKFLILWTLNPTKFQKHTYL